MDPGIYVNLFTVTYEDRRVDLMVALRTQFPKLRDLRKQLVERNIDARVYATGDDVYGYGPAQSQLADLSFKPANVSIAETPPLASRLIIDGYVDSLLQAGYTCRWSFGRATVYQFTQALLETPTRIRLFRGFELQSIFLLDPETDNLTYGIIIDAAFTYRDPDNNPLSPSAVATRYGQDTLRQLRTRQGDLSPRGGINLEVSRQRLVELILPFVAARHDFIIPGGLKAQLEQEPVRIILAGEEQST